MHGGVIAVALLDLAREVGRVAESCKVELDEAGRPRRMLGRARDTRPIGCPAGLDPGLVEPSAGQRVGRAGLFAPTAFQPARSARGIADRRSRRDHCEHGHLGRRERDLCRADRCPGAGRLYRPLAREQRRGEVEPQPVVAFELAAEPGLERRLGVEAEVGVERG